MFAFTLLIILASLYYLKPQLRNTVGIFALFFGIMSSIICMIGISLSIAFHLDPNVATISFLVLLSLEIPTVYIGLKGTRLLERARTKKIPSK
jgi:hypothetical protein